MNKTESKTVIQTRIELTPEEHAVIKEKADKQGISMRKYIKAMALHNSDGAYEWKNAIMQSMPAFYNSIMRVQDERVQADLLNWRKQLCQFLK